MTLERHASHSLLPPLHPQCIPGILDYYGNEQLFCDCSSAVDEQGFPYVGKFCEHSGKEKCGTTDDDHYCVNGGECNDNYP